MSDVEAPLADESFAFYQGMSKLEKFHADLNLYYAELITDQGMTAIRDWKRLKRLNLRGTRISDGTLQIVSRMTDLGALDIANTQVTDNGLDYLLTLTSLRELAIWLRRLRETRWLFYGCVRPSLISI